MRYAGLFLALVFAGFALVAGCSGDDETGGGAVLAQGTMTVPATGTVDLVTVEVTEPGTLRGTLTWSGAPTDLYCVFVHVTPGDAYGVTQSPSPINSVAAVTSARVAAGTQWLLRAANPSSTAVSVQYVITFIPE